MRFNCGSYDCQPQVVPPPSFHSSFIQLFRLESFPTGCWVAPSIVFAGSLAAETFGDYLAGSSHVLPTDGAARAWGGVSIYTFLKAMSVQTVTAEAARRIAEPAAVLARLEGLEAHARAADARLEALA